MRLCTSIRAILFFSCNNGTDILFFTMESISVQ